MLRAFVATACLCAATVGGAEPARLSGQEIRDLLAGAAVVIDAPLGTKLPVRYGRDGQLSGQARDLASYLGSATDTGQWWVSSDQLCHKWKRWLNSEPQCFRLRKEGRTLHWRASDGNTGTATITVPAPVHTAAVPPPVPAKAPEPNAAPEAAAAPAHASRVQPSAETRPAAAEPPAPPGRQVAAESAPVDTPAAQDPTAQAPGTPAPALGAPPEPKPAVRPKRPAQPGFVVVNVAQNDVLNVRSGPSADFEVVGELLPGSRGVVIQGACQSRWCPVVHLSASGWVNSLYLASEEPPSATPGSAARGDTLARVHPFALRDPADAPRTCLTPAAHALLERIEEKFGPVRVISTCRPGATIAGTRWPSRHASGNAVDFNAGSRKPEILEWLIANHRDGGTMTYADMDHIHVDIGRHFVSIAGGPRWASWRSN